MAPVAGDATGAASPQYVPVAQLLAGTTDVPQRIDAATIQYRGVICHVYGVLHGLTGGTNRQYKALVEDAIENAPGELVFGETKFAKLYRGIQVEMDDWTEIPLRDAFRMQFKAALTPMRMFMVAAGMRRERRTMADRFGANGLRRLQDIGGSAAFHALSPDERRRIAGFPEPYAYLVENCRRRAGGGDRRGPVFPDPDWRWLAMIEPELNIPLRSVFMLEFAVERARVLGASEISLFVGEIHNSDMVWLAGFDESAVDPKVRDMVDNVRRRAIELARGRRGALPGSASFWLRWRARPSRYRCTSASERGCGHEAEPAGCYRA
ncbi:hypothetical protein [Cupriavidus sp. H19C3]|uniref:hypothetical protein n=1 Tax=Cupriavidus sp. H19C3 TaxID=3241603 RepID=UPI003BF7D250